MFMNVSMNLKNNKNVLDNDMLTFPSECILGIS